MFDQTFVDRLAHSLAPRVAQLLKENMSLGNGKIEIRYMNIEQCSTYIGRSTTAVYRLVARREIPFIRNGRTLRFDRVAIDAWQKEGAL
jgi:excisionase family DNA binding protein